MTIQELRNARQAAWAKAEALDTKGKTAPLTDEELASVDALIEECKGYDADIKASEDAAAATAKRSTTLAEMRAAQTAPAKRKTADAVTNVRDRVEDDPKRGFANMGELLGLVRRAGTPGLMVNDNRLALLSAATGMNQGTGADGGFLVPPTFSTAIWDGLNATADDLVGMVDSYTVDGESLTFPANAETSRATGSRFGGAQAYWIAEAAQITSSRPKFRQVKLEPHQMAVLIPVTDKLLNNSPVSLEQYVSRVATAEINFLASDAIINGTGSGQPKGILNGTAGTTSCRVAVAKETGQAAATIYAENINKMWSRLHPRARAGAVWLINVDCEPALRKLSVDVGTGGLPAYLPPGGLSATPYSTLLGRPVVPIEYCATLGTEGDIILADMKYYAAGIRGGVDSAMSMHLRFDYAETNFRFMYEIDGQPWLASPITPYKGANTLSPFVTLATRA